MSKIKQAVNAVASAFMAFVSFALGWFVRRPAVGLALLFLAFMVCGANATSSLPTGITTLQTDGATFVNDAGATGIVVSGFMIGIRILRKFIK